MNKIMELRNKRNELWEKTKAFLEEHRDENGLVEASAVEQYEKMGAEVKALGAEIERLENQAPSVFFGGTERFVLSRVIQEAVVDDLALFEVCAVGIGRLNQFRGLIAITVDAGAYDNERQKNEKDSFGLLP